MNEDYDRNAQIPEVIPKVIVGEDGEPVIARERFIKPSPVPKALAAFLVLSAIVSGFFIIKGDRDRDHDRRAFQDKIDRQVARLDDQARELAQAQDDAARDRDNLRNLILALLAASGDPEKQKQILEQFTKEQARLNAERRAGGSTPTSPGTQGNPSPTPGPQPTATRSPQPRPTSTAKPSPSPTPGVVTICPPRLPVVGQVKCFP